jgi:hypothetical protein
VELYLCSPSIPSRLGKENLRLLCSLKERDYFYSEEKREIVVFYVMILLTDNIIIASMASGSSGVASFFGGLPV